jgi:nucleotide-binding universal stress UspA family protein
MLPQYNAILVATDFTPHSVLAFKHATMLARKNGAKIHLMHVVPVIDAALRWQLAAAIGEEKLDELLQKNQNKAHAEIKAELDEFAITELADHPEDLARFAGSHIIVDNPIEGILKLAAELNTDVIVMGTHHDKGMVEHMFIGSVTEKVIQRSTCPVFVVPLPKI